MYEKDHWADLIRRRLDQGHEVVREIPHSGGVLVTLLFSDCYSVAVEWSVWREVMRGYPTTASSW